jgi:hypothetical protein
MPPLPNVPKVVKCAVVLTDSINTDIVTRFYMRYTGSAPSAADLDAFATAVKTAWDDTIKGDVNSALALIRVECTDLSSATSAVGLWTGVVAGTATGVPVPVDSAVVVSYTIARRYRGGHPRGYWSAGEGIDLDNPQRWTPDFVASFQGSITTFFNEVAAAGWSGAGTLDHVNVSYFTGFTVVTSPTTGRARNVPNPRATPIIDPVVALVTRLRIGTQRRRLQYK